MPQFGEPQHHQITTVHSVNPGDLMLRRFLKSSNEWVGSLSLFYPAMPWVPEKHMQEQVRGFLEAEVHFISSFYSIAAMNGQTAEHLQRIICQYSSNEILTIMCMGHNRGWEEVASMFTGASIELKACNAALLEAPGKSWEEAFSVAGYGGWKLQGLARPSSNL